MNHHALVLLFAALLTHGVMAQANQPTRILAPATLADAQLRATAALANPDDDAAPAARAGAVLAALRCGDAATASARLAAGRERLRRSTGAQDLPEEVAWLAAATLWTVRALGEDPAATRQLPELLAAIDAAAGAPRARAFAAEALQVHMLLCAGNLLDHKAGRRRDPGARAGAAWSARAIDRLLELERETWQPGRGHYRPRATAGELALPALPDASLLVPAAAGMLVGSGGRVLQHLQAVLADPGIDPADPHYLAAATLCRDAGARMRSFTALSASPRRDDPAQAGFAFDALCYATIGVRLAVGAAVDEDWVRFAPWLPPGCDRLEVRSLCSHGARFDLLCTVSAARTLRVQVRLTWSGNGAARHVVVQGDDEQHLGMLHVGECFTTELACRQPEAQHEALAPAAEARRIR